MVGWARKWAKPDPGSRADLSVWQRAALIGALRDPVLAGYARQILFTPRVGDASSNTLEKDRVRAP